LVIAGLLYQLWRDGYLLLWNAKAHSNNRCWWGKDVKISVCMSPWPHLDQGKFFNRFDIFTTKQNDKNNNQSQEDNNNIKVKKIIIIISQENNNKRWIILYKLNLTIKFAKMRPFTIKFLKGGWSRETGPIKQNHPLVWSNPSAIKSAGKHL
jgi:hypothetical protein